MVHVFTFFITFAVMINFYLNQSFSQSKVNHSEILLEDTAASNFFLMENSFKKEIMSKDVLSTANGETQMRSLNSTSPVVVKDNTMITLKDDITVADGVAHVVNKDFYPDYLKNNLENESFGNGEFNLKEGLLENNFPNESLIQKNDIDNNSLGNNLKNEFPNEEGINHKWWCDMTASSEKLRKDGQLKEEEVFKKFFQDGEYDPEKIDSNDPDWVNGVWNKFFDHDKFWDLCLSGSLPSDCINYKKELTTQVDLTTCELVKYFQTPEKIKSLSNFNDDLLTEQIRTSFEEENKEKLDHFYKNPGEVIDSFAEANKKNPPKLFSFFEDLDIISLNNFGLFFDINIYIVQMVSIFFFFFFFFCHIFLTKMS